MKADSKAHDRHCDLIHHMARCRKCTEAQYLSGMCGEGGRLHYLRTLAESQEAKKGKA